MPAVPRGLDRPGRDRRFVDSTRLLD